MHGGENLHRRRARINALKFLVDVENATELAIKLMLRDMCQIEINTLPVLLNGQSFVDTDIENLARRDIARHEVLVFRIALFEEVIALVFGNAKRIARVLRRPRHPHATSFTTS